MNKLSIEELKSLREAYYGMQYEKIVAVLDELIAIRELKGDQVPVAWTSQRSLETKNKIVAFTDDMSALDYGTANGWTDIVELFTVPQKPVVLHDERDHYQDTDEYEQGYVRGWNASRMEAKAAIEAAGGIVKDGE